MKLTSNVSRHEWKILFLALAMISSCWIIVLYVFFDWYIPYLDIFLDYQKWSAENNHLVEFRNHMINNNDGIETNVEFRDLIIDMCGDLPRLEMFARESAPGWSSYGNEVDNSIVI